MSEKHGGCDGSCDEVVIEPDLQRDSSVGGCYEQAAVIRFGGAMTAAGSGGPAPLHDAYSSNRCKGGSAAPRGASG